MQRFGISNKVILPEVVPLEGVGIGAPPPNPSEACAPYSARSYPTKLGQCSHEHERGGVG